MDLLWENHKLRELVAYHSAKRVTNDLAFNQTMQKKYVLPRNQNEVDLMQLASRACARHCKQFGGQLRSNDL